MEDIGSSVSWLPSVCNLTFLLTILLVAAMCSLYFYFIHLPMNCVKDLSDVGFEHIRCARTRFRHTSDEATISRNGHDLPPVYPNGWFALLESRDLRVKECKAVSALGQELAVFRSEDEQVHVLDAYCPHLGANMAVGGRVKGDCLECPFHGWLFRGADGKCSRIPYAETVPDFVKTRSWLVCEKNGFVFIWHHAENSPPDWQLPDIPELKDKTWIFCGRTEHTVSCHIQEIPENGADLNHLQQIHSDSAFAGRHLGKTDTSVFAFAKHEWNSTWGPDTPPNDYQALMTIKHTFGFLGLNLSWMEINLKVQQIGPAVVHLRFKSHFGDGIFLQCITPCGPLRQRLVHHLYTASSVPRFLAKLYLSTQDVMVERDIMIWNNKKFRKQPLLIKEDLLISRYRRWYSRFYSENSPTLQSCYANSLSW